MARSTSFPLALALAGLSLLCTESTAEAAPKKADLLRTWEVEGADTLGDYVGSVEITRDGSYRLALQGELTYSDGTQRTWSGTGYYVFGKVYANYPMPAGIIGGLNGASSIDVRVRMIPNQRATHIESTHEGGGFQAQEALYRLNRAGDGYRWSARVLARLLAEHGLEASAEDAVLLAAAPHDNGNGYLSGKELEAGIADLPSADPIDPTVALGIISDIDKTILPPHTLGGALPAPYPGVASLYAELSEEVTYVTARTAAMVVDIPDWLALHDLPEGPVESGTDNFFAAQAEKVRDIEKTLAAHPDVTFVLFGDSSHRDPEVYKEIMTKYPDRVAAVFIHRVNNVNPNRVVGMNLIEDHAEIAAKLYELGLLDLDAAKRVIQAARAEGLVLTDAEADALLGL